MWLTPCHSAPSECVCVLVEAIPYFPQKQLYCPLQIICNWIFLFTWQAPVQLTLIIPSNPVEDESTLLWFQTLCMPLSARSLHLLYSQFKQENICFYFYFLKLYLHCYSKHKIICHPLWPQMSGGEREKNPQESGRHDWWLYPLWFWDPCTL